MRLLPILLFSAMALSCASHSTAPRFDKPSTAAIGQAHKNAIAHIEKAQDQAKQIEKDCPQDEAIIVALSSELDSAKSELQTSEGARIQLDQQLTQQTNKANKLADSYDKSQAKISSLEVSRHRWVKILLASVSVNVAALAWIFRKPIMLLAAGL